MVKRNAKEVEDVAVIVEDHMVVVDVLVQHNGRMECGTGWEDAQWVSQKVDQKDHVEEELEDSVEKSNKIHHKVMVVNQITNLLNRSRNKGNSVPVGTIWSHQSAPSLQHEWTLNQVQRNQMIPGWS